MEINLEKVNNDRASFDKLGNIYPVDGTVKITSEAIAGVTCYWFVPRTFDEHKMIIFLHGGLFGLGSIQSHRPMVSHFASALFTKSFVC
jgi:epsilon-lactone hydrolase